MPWKKHIGTDNPASVLNDLTVKDIRRKLDSKRAIAAIAREHMVSRRTIYDIRSRRTWKHV